MQNGKAGSYFWARAGPAAETDAIAKIAKAKRRIGTFLAIDGTASAHGNTPAMLIPVNSPWRYPARVGCATSMNDTDRSGQTCNDPQCPGCRPMRPTVAKRASRAQLLSDTVTTIRRGHGLGFSHRATSTISQPQSRSLQCNFRPHDNNGHALDRYCGGLMVSPPASWTMPCLLGPKPPKAEKSR